jgi:hypothetical protein
MQQVLDICKQQQTDIINNSWIEETSDAIKEKKHLDSIEATEACEKTMQI